MLFWPYYREHEKNKKSNASKNTSYTVYYDSYKKVMDWKTKTRKTFTSMKFNPSVSVKEHVGSLFSNIHKAFLIQRYCATPIIPTSASLSKTPLD